MGYEWVSSNPMSCFSICIGDGVRKIILKNYYVFKIIPSECGHNLSF